MSRDLFGFDKVAGPGKGEVEPELRLIRESDRAWFLGPPEGAPGDSAWVPKSLCSRGEGRDENLWTLPKWKAGELGWA